MYMLGIEYIIYNMASWCVSAISKIVARGEAEGCYRGVKGWYCRYRPWSHVLYITYISVSPRINIKGGGVHDVWSTMFNQCYKTVFLGINFKLKDVGARLKGGWYYPLGEILHI